MKTLKSANNAKNFSDRGSSKIFPSLKASNPRRSKLAIVGMAGRFPNAADHEKFWNLLEAGLDVHKRVCFGECFERCYSYQ